MSAYATSALAALPTDALRKAVTDGAGVDPKAQLRMIAALQSSGVIAPSVGGQANTAPSQTQTPVAGSSADPDVLAASQLAEMQKDPRKALAMSRFRSEHGPAIARGQQKLANK